MLLSGGNTHPTCIQAQLTIYAKVYFLWNLDALVEYTRNKIKLLIMLLTSKLFSIADIT